MCSFVVDCSKTKCLYVPQYQGFAYSFQHTVFKILVLKLLNTRYSEGKWFFLISRIFGVGEGFAYSFEKGERLLGAWETGGDERLRRGRERGRENFYNFPNQKVIFNYFHTRADSRRLSVSSSFLQIFLVHHLINEQHTQKYLKKSRRLCLILKLCSNVFRSIT